MPTRRNASGLPLSGLEWLETHHRAKLSERRAAARMLSSPALGSVLDLGCGGGHWLEVFHETLPPWCTFTGVDIDAESLLSAERRSRSWGRSTTFISADLNDPGWQIPPADLTLLFNMSGFIDDFGGLLSRLSSRPGPRGTIAIRQYDGAMMRFGPLEQPERTVIETALLAATYRSRQFRHYDTDRVLREVHQSQFMESSVRYEVLHRSAPFDEDFRTYFDETLLWTRAHVSDRAKRILDRFRSIIGPGGDLENAAYVVQVDLSIGLS